MNSNETNTMLLRIKICMYIIIIGLFFSGISAFPIQTELEIFANNSSANNPMANWLHTIYNAVKTTNQNYPWLSYGTDWLAFAHIMLAVLFIGPLINPVKNKWVIQFGIIACLSIFPLAFIAGSIRQIPLFWRFIDCSFGVFGSIPLFVALRDIKRIEAHNFNTTTR